jgi:hypothetical protein
MPKLALQAWPCGRQAWKITQRYSKSKQGKTKGRERERQRAERVGEQDAGLTSVSNKNIIRPWNPRL